jgi:hypothetical protein
MAVSIKAVPNTSGHRAGKYTLEIFSKYKITAAPMTDPHSVAAPPSMTMNITIPEKCRPRFFGTANPLK